MKGTTVAIIGIALVGGFFVLRKVGGRILKGIDRTCPICANNPGSQACAQCLKEKLGPANAAYAHMAYDSEFGGIGTDEQANDFYGDAAADPVPSFDASDINISSMVARAYDTDSQYKMLAMNPYFMKYGPYGSYYGSGYDSYLSNWSPK